MLSFILEHRKAIDKYTGDRRNDLRQFELTVEEWRIVKQLCDILEVSYRCLSMLIDAYIIDSDPWIAYIIDFWHLIDSDDTCRCPQNPQILKDATLFFSRATPNLAHVIPTMDIISDRLTAKANDPTISPAIRSALGLAKRTLNRYYSRTDDSEAYRIAMSKFSRYFYACC
jgi:hypothetical protein